MTTETNKRFKNSTMVLEGNTIKWENHMIQITNISQIWMGNCPNEQLPSHLALILFFIALSGISPVNIIIMLLSLVICLIAWSYWYWKQKDDKGINFQISSGKVYSFVSNNEEFTCQVYDLISDLIAKNSTIPNIQISFQGDGNIIDNSIIEKEKTADKQILNIMSNGMNEQLVSDLKKLFISYTQKNDINEEILDLIEKTIQLLNINDRQGIKNSFSKLIKMGLINDCNQLGLCALIEAMRTSVY